MKNPCNNCPDRVLHCHSTCKKYLAYSDYRKEILEKIRKEKGFYTDYVEVRKRGVQRRLRKIR